jgi:hypothetical protein
MNSKYYASSNLAAGRATCGIQVSGELPDKERYSDSPGFGFGYGADNAIVVKEPHTVSDGQKRVRRLSKYTETRNMECTFIAQEWYEHILLIDQFPGCR